MSTKSAINKPAMNYRTILIAAVFHFVHQVEKDIGMPVLVCQVEKNIGMPVVRTNGKSAGQCTVT